MVALIQGVVLRGAEGNDVATGHAIRVLRLTHETLQPTAHEAAKGSDGPIMPRFNRPMAAQVPDPSSILPPAEDPGVKLIGPDGTEYVTPG